MEYVKWSLHNAWEDYLEGDCQLRIAQMERLREHKYSAVDVLGICGSVLSYVDCSKCYHYVGIFINLVTVLVLAGFSYDAKIAASSWAYFQAALGVFLFQTLDATDGKQARRTGSSSPLGELLDHGCDAMSQVLVTLNICYAMLLGQERYVVLFVIVSSVVLFIAHTGARTVRDFLHISLKYVAISIASIVCISQIGDYVVDVVTGGVGKNGSTVADTSVLSPLIPLLMMITPFCMIYSKSVTSVYDDHITLFVLCLGAVSTKATMRLILAHMSRSELAMWDWIYLSPLMMMLNQYYDMPLNEFYLLICATASIRLCQSDIILCNDHSTVVCAP
ncbi:CDP-alcohol phosphatidyltransferase [Dirofilaria immitis]|nr:CDP-alcohol phosphatidyltransferase [Dirofilaria immitis]